MALITMRKPDGQTMTIDENSPLKASLTAQGWSQVSASATTSPTTTTSSSSTSSKTSSGWVDPANGNPTPVGVGQLKTEYDKQNIESKSENKSSNELFGSSTTNTSGITTVNSLYNKYFNRDATSAESSYWTSQKGDGSSASLNRMYQSLETQLKTDYKNASGIDYDGSPITQGQTKTQNQLSGQTSTSAGKTFYRDGVDIYDASTGQKISSTDWANNWSGKATEVTNPQASDTGDMGDTGTGETGIDLSMYDSIINGDAFLSEQFKDENIKTNFSKMSPTLQMAYLQMLQSLGKTIEAGKVINPNIEITPEKIKEFTDQATSELDPYYQEQIKNYKADLDTSISRLTEDFKTGVRNAEDPFKRNLAVQAENEAQAGLTYGSERGVRENINVSDQQQKIDELAKTTGRSLEDTYKQAERTLGSDVLGSVNASLPTYGVSNQGFSSTGSRNLFAPTGGVIGSLPKEQTVAVKGRASELEEAYRNQRILNSSQL